MAKYIDAVSISLNAPTAERYQEVTQPCFENAFPDMLAFAEKAKKLFSSVQFSVVSIISQEEIDASQKLADEMGIPLKVRIYSFILFSTIINKRTAAILCAVLAEGSKETGLIPLCKPFR